TCGATGRSPRRPAGLTRFSGQCALRRRGRFPRASWGPCLLPALRLSLGCPSAFDLAEEGAQHFLYACSRRSGKQADRVDGHSGGFGESRASFSHRFVVEGVALVEGENLRLRREVAPVSL